MAEFQFLDKIINTVSLQVKPNNTYKTKTYKYLPSFAASHIPNHLSSSQNSYLASNKSDYLFGNTIFYVDQSFTPAQISIPQNYYYYSTTVTLFVKDGFSTNEEYDNITTLNAQPEYQENIYPVDTTYSSYNFIVSQQQNLLNFASSLSSVAFADSSNSFILSAPASYQEYKQAKTILNTFIIDKPLYVQNLEDNLNLALDLTSNTIIEEEQIVASTYTPPDPSDITIITLKEFWA